MSAKRPLVWSIGLAVALLCLLAGVAEVASVFVNGKPHKFSTNECFGCHFTIPEEGSPRPLPLMKDVTPMCTGCHEVSRLSHIVDVKPLIPIPDGMPLGKNGVLTCVTCHDPHTSPTDPATGKKTYFLRLAGPGKPFCLLCHEDRNIKGEVAIFAPSGGVTHRRSMNLSHGFEKFAVVDPPEEIDPLSSMCMACHDESEGDPDRKALAKGKWSHGGGIGRSHPIGMNYADAAWNNKELVSPRDLDSRIVLFDEKLGCCSCHNMYSAGGGAGLVLGSPDNYQDLCFGCHIK